MAVSKLPRYESALRRDPSLYLSATLASALSASAAQTSLHNFSGRLRRFLRIRSFHEGDVLTILKKQDSGMV